MSVLPKLILFSLCIASPLTFRGQGRNYQKKLDVADAYFEVGEYGNALPYYIKVARQKKSADLGIKVSKCYVNMRDYKNAAQWYAKSIDKNSNTSDILDYLHTLKRQEEYTKAKGLANLYASSAHKSASDTLNHFIAGCDSALSWTKANTSVVVTNLWEVNSAGSEVAPSCTENKLYFSSSRESVTIKTKSGFSSEPYYNIYWTAKKDDVKWKTPHLFSSSINSHDHEVGITFSVDRKDLYFTRSTHKQYLNSTDDKQNRMKLYRTTKKGIGWTKPEFFMLNDSSASFGHPTLGMQDKVFIFASDLPGGYGGTDLYMCYHKGNGWTVPVNLGPNINTAGDELYPHLSENNELYFSSNGHHGLGGFDIFITTLSSSGWAVSLNLKAPINSPSDDFSFVVRENGKVGYFSSNRKKGRGKEDLYQVVFK